VTISSTTNRVTYTGDGATTAFPVSFPFHAKADLVVVQITISNGVEVTKTLDVDYTISGSADSLGHYPNGGTVNATTAPSSLYKWLIYRSPALTQGVDLVEGGPLTVESEIESPLDRLTMIALRNYEIGTRSVRLPEGSSGISAVLPIPAALKWPRWNAAGTALENINAASLGSITAVGPSLTLAGGNLDVTTPIHSSIVVPLGRMQRAESSDENGGIVTVLVTETSIVTLGSLGTVVVGDRILVCGYVEAVKGGTAGNTLIEISKGTGTATIVFLNSAAFIRQRHYCQIGGTDNWAIFGIAKVTVGGTLTFKLTGLSAGSDSTVAAGSGQLHAIVLNNG
jgi:hypothetical protein